MTALITAAKETVETRIMNLSLKNLINRAVTEGCYI